MPAKDFNRVVLLSLLDIVSDEEFAPVVNGTVATPQPFFRYVRNSNNSSARKIIALMSEKVENRMQPLRRGVFHGKPSEEEEEDKVLQELGSEQIRQLYRLALDVNGYACKDARISEYFKLTFSSNNGCLPTSLVVGGQFLQHRLNNSTRRHQPSHALGIDTPSVKPSLFDVLLFLHALNFIHALIEKKKLRCMRDYKNGNIVGLAVQKITSCFRRLVIVAGESSLQKMVAPYIFFHRRKLQFQVLRSRKDGYAPLIQNKTLEHNIQRPLPGPEEVNIQAVNRSDEEDAARRYVAYMLFDSIHSVCGNKSLHERDSQECLELAKFSVPDEPVNDAQIPSVFSSVPCAVWDGLGVARPTFLPSYSEVPLADNSAKFENTDVLYTGNTRRPTETVSHPQPQRTKKRRRREDQSLKQIEEEEKDVISAVQTDSDDVMRRAMVTLRNAMQGSFDMYAVDFRQLVGEHKVKSGLSIVGLVQLVLCDPPYTVRRKYNKTNSGYDEFQVEDRRELVDETATFLRPGGHAHVFCATEDVAAYEKVVRRHMSVRKSVSTDESENEDSDDEEVVPLQTTAEVETFDMDTSVVFYVRGRECNFQDPRSRNVGFMSMVEVAVHFWKKGLTWAEMRSMIQYNTVSRYIESSYPGWANVTDNVPQPGPDETVFATDGEHRKRVRAEQKSVKWMMDIVERLTRPGDIVVDFTAGTFPVLKACMLLPKHRRFVGCDIDKMCVEASQQSAVLTYAKQVLSASSDIEGTDAVREAAQVYVKAFTDKNHARA